MVWLAHNCSTLKRVEAYASPDDAAQHALAHNIAVPSSGSKPMHPTAASAPDMRPDYCSTLKRVEAYASDGGHFTARKETNCSTLKRVEAYASASMIGGTLLPVLIAVPSSGSKPMHHERTMRLVASLMVLQYPQAGRSLCISCNPGALTSAITIAVPSSGSKPMHLVAFGIAPFTIHYCSTLKRVEAYASDEAIRVAAGEVIIAVPSSGSKPMHLDFRALVGH